jgi:hypothetical protein
MFALAAMLGLGFLSAGDLTITYNTTAKGALAKGGGTEIHYYTPAFHLNRNEGEKRDTLIDFGKDTTYTIDHKKKTIEMMKMEDALAALEGMDQAQPAAMGAMMGAMFGNPNEFKVDKLGPEQVAGRSCQDYLIQAGKLKMALSADPSLKIPVPDAAFNRMMKSRAAAFAKAGPMGASFKRLYEEMAKIKGVPLKTHLTGFMGMDVATEATRIEQTPVPSALFVLPAGYKMEDMGKKLREEMRAK